MRNRIGSLLLAVLGYLTFFITGTAAWAQTHFTDPWQINGRTASQPHQFWQSEQSLPKVSVPERREQPEGSASLTLPELTEFALRNNPRTRQAWLAARAAAAGVGIEKADLLPQITANYAVNRTRPVSATTGSVSPWITRYGPAVSFSYLLFDFGVQLSQYEAAEYRLLAANLTQNRVLQDVMFQVEQAYYRTIGLDALVRSNELSLKNIRTVHDAVQRHRESGLATVADVYRAETQVAQAELNLTRSRGDLEKARGQLASAVGLPVNGRINVQPLSYQPQTQRITASISDLLEQAKASRPDLVAAEAQARASRATAHGVSKAGLPSLEISGGSGRTWFGDDRAVVNNYTLGLNVRIPIFSGFRDTYLVRQSEAQAAQAEAARDVLMQQTELDVWQSYYDLQTATSSTGSTEAQVKSAEQTAQATLARYQAGFGSILDLITAQQDESNARVQRIQSFLDWYTALARLNFSMGVNNILAATGEKK